MISVWFKRHDNLEKVLELSGKGSWNKWMGVRSCITTSDHFTEI
jgi:hypothetical protein